MNFYKKAMMAEGGEMPEYGQGGKMPQYQEGGMMDKGAQQLKMLKAQYDKAVEEGNREMVDKIESAVSEMMMSAKDDRVKEMLMDMFPGMGKSMQKGGKLKMVENEDGEMVPFYAADGKGKMAYGGKMEMPHGGEMEMPHGGKMEMPGGGMMEMKKMMMAYGGTMDKKKKKKMTYPGGGYVMMK